MKNSLKLKYLSKNISLLGRLLGEVLEEQEGSDFYELVEYFRIKARKTRFHKKKPNKKLLKKIATLSSQEKVKLAKAFTEFLRLSNLAEQVHRIRVKRDIYRKSEIQSHSIQEVFLGLKSRYISAERVEKVLNDNFQIELVFTAHPTEILLPESIAIYQLIAKLLLRLDQRDLASWENKEIKDSLKRKIFILWKSSFLRQNKPTPLDEAKVGLEFSKDILWKTLPNFYKDIKSSFYDVYNKRLKIRKEIFTFASWMGGDRDGNPHVTCKMTEKIIYESTQTAINLYRREIKKILNSISSSPLNKALDFIDDLEKSLKCDHDILKFTKEKFVFLLDKAQKLALRSNEKVWAQGPINDLIVRAKSFGLSLLKIDIRENAIEHEKIIHEFLLTKKIKYSSLSSEEKTKLLIHSCQDKSLFAVKNLKDRDILHSLKLRDKYPEEFFNSYIVSMSEKPEHILEVYFLYHLLGVENPLHVIPLFETPESLEDASEVLKTLFSNNWYKKLINNKQEIMIGYSDSGKRSGRFHAAWSLNKAQIDILKVAKEFEIDLNFFHGRGGSIARGGGPIRLAMLSLTDSLVTQKIRITEQGESIRHKFGLPQIAERTLELYFSGFLESVCVEKKSPSIPKKFEDFMENNTQKTHLAYKEFLSESEGFIDFYSKATPVEELSLLNMGSRPSRRKKTKSLDDLRAIPWVFSWTQNRTLLPSWLGCEAIDDTPENLKKLTYYYKNSLFFKATIDLINMTLAKADMGIFKLYVEKLLPKNEESENLKNEIIGKYFRSREILQKITGSKSFLKDHPILKRSIKLRNPYVDVLNLLQIHALDEFRKNPKNIDYQVLPISIAGIAAGMRNSG